MIIVDTDVILHSLRGASTLLIGSGGRPAGPARAKMTSFWKEVFSSSKASVIPEVFNELHEGKDKLGRELVDFILNNARDVILTPTSRYYEALKRVGEWIRRHYGVEEWEEFERKADPHLVAHAVAIDGAIVLTHETAAPPQIHGKGPRIQGTPRIPFVAYHFGVRTCRLYELLIEAKANGIL